MLWRPDRVLSMCSIKLERYSPSRVLGALRTANSHQSRNTASDKGNGRIGSLPGHHIAHESLRQLRFGAEKWFRVTKIEKLKKRLEICHNTFENAQAH